MRTVLALLVGAAVGFGGGWLAFHERTSDSTTAIETRFVKAIRRENPEVDRASCAERQSSGGRQFLCTVYYPGRIAALSDYVVTARGDRLEYRRR